MLDGMDEWMAKHGDDLVSGRLDDIRLKKGLPVSKRKRMWLRYELSEVE